MRTGRKSHVDLDKEFKSGVFPIFNRKFQRFLHMEIYFDYPSGIVEKV